MIAFFRYDFEQEEFILIGYHRERSIKSGFLMIPGIIENAKTKIKHG
jgi:hypothetical protein